MTDRNLRISQAIWQITQELRNAETLDDAISASLEIVIDTLDSEAGSIWLLDKGTNRLYTIFNHGPADISGITSTRSFTVPLLRPTDAKYMGVSAVTLTLEVERAAQPESMPDSTGTPPEGDNGV